MNKRVQNLLEEFLLPSQLDKPSEAFTPEDLKVLTGAVAYAHKFPNLDQPNTTDFTGMDAEIKNLLEQQPHVAIVEDRLQSVNPDVKLSPITKLALLSFCETPAMAVVAAALFAYVAKFHGTIHFQLNGDSTVMILSFLANKSLMKSFWDLQKSKTEEYGNMLDNPEYWESLKK